MSEAAQPQPYAVVLTSCGRFDLLRQTVESLLRSVDQKPAEFIIVEDSGDAAAGAALEGLDALLGRAFTLLLNRPQLGQIRAIDRAYAAVTAPFVFHCEDDWEFTRGGFIAESFRLLAARPDVSMAGLRPRDELNPLVRDAPRLTLDDGEGAPLSYFESDPALHPEYFSYSFNPGLRRMADYRRLGPFEPLGHEPDVSYAFKKAGFRIANLEPPATRHLGDGRHVSDPTTRDKPRNVVERLRRSAGKRAKRLLRWLKGD